MIAFSAWLTIASVVVAVFALVIAGLAWFGVTRDSVVTVAMVTVCALIVTMVACGVQALEPDPLLRERVDAQRKEQREACADGASAAAGSFDVPEDVTAPERRDDRRRMLQVAIPATVAAMLFGFAELVGMPMEWSLMWRVPAVCGLLAFLACASTVVTLPASVKHDQARRTSNSSSLLVDRICVGAFGLISFLLLIGLAVGGTWLAAIGCLIALAGPWVIHRLLQENSQQYRRWYGAMVVSGLQRRAERLSSPVDR